MRSSAPSTVNVASSPLRVRADSRLRIGRGDRDRAGRDRLDSAAVALGVRRTRDRRIARRVVDLLGEVAGGTAGIVTGRREVLHLPDRSLAPRAGRG